SSTGRASRQAVRSIRPTRSRPSRCARLTPSGRHAVADPTQSTQHQVAIIRYGTRQATRSEVYLNYPLYAEDDGAIGMDYFFWVVRGIDETILVDTGFTRAAGEARGRTVLFEPTEAFTLAGVEP